MGFFYRSRKNFGPFALNFSTKGIGISAGITGARLSVGPNGTYIHLGRKGFYYRKKINFHQKTEPNSFEEVSPEVALKENRIETADIVNFQDSSSDKLLEEIKEKNSLIKYSSISFGVSGAILIIGLLNGFPTQLNLFIIFISTILYSYLFKIDSERKQVVVTYKLDKNINSAFEKVNAGFNSLRESQKIWRIETQQNTDDWKRNAGANSLVKRKSIQILCELPPFFDSNLIPYGFKIDDKQYYFFPDRILIYQGNRVGVFYYNELAIDTSTSIFLEEGGVPSDSEIVGHSWRYQNRDGGPDRRFNNNSKIPNVLYSYLDLSTYSGINLKLQVSNKNSAKEFSESFEGIKNVNSLSGKSSELFLESNREGMNNITEILNNLNELKRKLIKELPNMSEEDRLTYKSNNEEFRRLKKQLSKFSKSELKMVNESLLDIDESKPSVSKQIKQNPKKLRRSKINNHVNNKKGKSKF